MVMAERRPNRSNTAISPTTFGRITGCLSCPTEKIPTTRTRRRKQATGLRITSFGTLSLTWKLDFVPCRTATAGFGGHLDGWLRSGEDRAAASRDLSIDRRAQ